MNTSPAISKKERVLTNAQEIVFSRNKKKANNTPKKNSIPFFAWVPNPNGNVLMHALSLIIIRTHTKG